MQTKIKENKQLFVDLEPGAVWKFEMDTGKGNIKIEARGVNAEPKTAKPEAFPIPDQIFIGANKPLQVFEGEVVIIGLKRGAYKFQKYIEFGGRQFAFTDGDSERGIDFYALDKINQR